MAKTEKGHENGVFDSVSLYRITVSYQESYAANTSAHSELLAYQKK